LNTVPLSFNTLPGAPSEMKIIPQSPALNNVSLIQKAVSRIIAISYPDDSNKGDYYMMDFQILYELLELEAIPPHEASQESQRILNG
jgi:hypothetical protein